MKRYVDRQKHADIVRDGVTAVSNLPVRRQMRIFVI